MNKLSNNPQCYLELNLPTISGNKGKKSTETIGTSKIDFTFYPNDTEIRCSSSQLAER